MRLIRINDEHLEWLGLKAGETGAEQGRSRKQGLQENTDSHSTEKEEEVFSQNGLMVSKTRTHFSS